MAIERDRLVVPFTGTDSGHEPLTWGQKAILQDMRASGNQFTMGGRIGLRDGTTVADAAARVSALVGRHAALRMRLTGGGAQEVAECGELSLDILTLPDDADAARFAADLMDEWPDERYDFQRDWPLRAAVVRHRGACVNLVWTLSHLAADGGGHQLLLADLLADGADGVRPQLLDVARSEQTEPLRQLSRRALRYWETQLRRLPAQTFGEPTAGPDGPRYAQARFRSTAAHLAIQAIAGRTGTDVSRATLAVIATAIARATGRNPLTLKVMVNNRFRPGLADVIAPVAQNSAVTVDVAGVSIDEVVARTRAASLTAGMRAYCDPDDLAELAARLDAERGYPAAITCRVNDQRAMVMRAEDPAAPAGVTPDEVTPDEVRRRREETTLTWLGPKENMHEQATMLIENRPGAVSLHLMWDVWSLTGERVESLLRGVEEVAVEAALDPAAPPLP